MAIKTSTGLRNTMLTTGSLKEALDGGKIRIFTGPVPASADEAETGTLLCEITVNSTATGLTFESSAEDGVISKAALEIWSGIKLASGRAAYYRHVSAADDGLSSTTLPRIQGSVGLAGADLNLSVIDFEADGVTKQTIDYYTIALPTT